MTADGTGDELIKLEGWCKDKQYTFMDVELDDDEGSDCDEHVMDDCWIDIPEYEPPIPDEDGEDVDATAEFEEVSNEPDELELSDEPLEIPAGYEAMHSCPYINKLSGTKIMFLWDFGWDLGTVKKRIWRGKYNYFVQYPNDDGTFDEYRQTLSTESYHDVDASTGHWIVLRKLDD